MVQDRSVADVSDDEKPVNGEQEQPLARTEVDKSKSEQVLITGESEKASQNEESQENQEQYEGGQPNQKKRDEMRDLYDKTKEGIQNTGSLDRMSTLNLVNTIIRRKRLKITFKQILIGTCPCRRQSKVIDRKNKTAKNQKIFDKAQKMLNKQFDVTNLLRMVNLTQVLLSALLTREEQLLLLFQRRQIVETGDEDDEADSD